MSYYMKLKFTHTSTTELLYIHPVHIFEVTLGAKQTTNSKYQSSITAVWLDHLLFSPISSWRWLSFFTASVQLQSFRPDVDRFSTEHQAAASETRVRGCVVCRHK